ncbi:hypothetical protein [Bacillus testis]|uniref:hypothetical protein n=1 Tax=Bacillus testis TaxID=1622072 RepID=UPI000B287A60|nr:hypothetical protein [Bacillus testis]
MSDEPSQEPREQEAIQQCLADQTQNQAPWYSRNKYSTAPKSQLTKRKITSENKQRLLS